MHLQAPIGDRRRVDVDTRQAMRDAVALLTLDLDQPGGRAVAERGLTALTRLIPALVQAAGDILALHRDETGAEPGDVVAFLGAHHAAQVG